MKIILCGPPRSGKSCLREGLKQAIRRIPSAPYPYVITACPDGEGAWFQETVTADPALAAQLKAAYKSKFTPTFVKRIAESVANCNIPLTLIDIGGIASQENEQICASATHAIILAGDMDRIPEWQAFCKKLNIRIIAEIQSDYSAREDTIPTRKRNGKWTGSVHYLERGEPVADRPTIVQLANIIVGIGSCG